MTSDEVILRRQRSIDENGCETTEPPPPPRLRGQSTYLALLSSLATDLDIMLNDLRSSPSSRLLSPASRSPSSSSPATVGGSGSGGGGGSSSSSGVVNDISTSSTYLRSNQSVQIIPSQSVSTTTTVVTREASPVPEHRYHHYYYQQQYSTHNFQQQQQQSHRLNQDFYYHRFHNSNHHHQRSNGLRSGNAHATAAQSSSSRGAFQSIVTTIATTAETTSGSGSSLISHQHQTSAETASALATTATTSTTTQLGSITNRTASAAHNERDAFWSSESNQTSHHQNQIKSSHRRIPFCGLDSVKGNDNNGLLNGTGNNLIINNNNNNNNNINNIHNNNNNGGGSGVGIGIGNGAGGNNINTNGGSGNTNSSSNSFGNGGSITNPPLSSYNMTSTEQFHSLEGNDSSCCGDGQFEDDLQALLPNCRQLSRDEISQSRASLVSSSDGGVLAEGETSSEASENSDGPPCDLGLVERLLRTHPVWFLPGIQRSGAVHFLQGKEEGNFIVRNSSQPSTMAVSVRLPPDTGPYIEHYLIQSNGGVLSLESSRFKFDSIPALIAHYAQCCDELPVQLILPRALREANNRQQLSSLALLGQEFWRYPMSSSNPNEAKSPNSLTDTSGIGMTVFSSASNTHNQQLNTAKLFSPTNQLAGLFSPLGTPSDTASSMSSFTTSGGQNMQLMSPESVDSVILTMSPVDAGNNRALGVGGVGTDTKLSTFKSTSQQKLTHLDNGIRPQRPTPPNTLNLAPRKPPAPPVRWSKPLTPNSPVPPSDHFAVTTPTTYCVDIKNQQQFVELISPPSQNNATFQTFSKRLSPEGECKDTLSSQGSSNNRWNSQSSKDSNQSQKKMLSPSSTTGSSSNGKHRKLKQRKESKHYKECDILESQQIYCRSALGDKISDYEDLWSQDPSERAGLLSTFRPPDGTQGKRPDLLAETPTITSLNCNILSPANSVSSSASPPSESLQTPTACPTTTITTVAASEATTDLLSPLDANKNFIQVQTNAHSRSRSGLVLPLTTDDALKASESDTTPTAQTPVSSRSKQGSPFYAEPADALRAAGLTASILRRSQRGALLPANHRHSEPPKGGIARTPICPVLVPSEIEKIAGSLDELKKKQQQQPAKRPRGRNDHWQIDSSWEFMGKNDENDPEYGDYDSEEQWSGVAVQKHPSQLNGENKENKERPITVHQIIAKRLPDLNLPELVRCSTPQQQQQPIKENKIENHNGGFRHSSYDNVEKNFPFTYSNGMDSGQSDDGTVFSEPWDSTQWDSFLPPDDSITSESIHLSKCRPTLMSEDDSTIIEDISTKDSQGTLKANRPRYQATNQKVATILRNPSMRDREILCHPRNKVNPVGGPGDSVRCYTLQLASDNKSTFAQNIENFISCTKESREAAPQVVMRNMRQFMNGMKNYLVKHGEGKFHQEVESARARLKSDEFLNLDAILETVMHQLVVLPLRDHLYGMFVDYYTRTEDIQLLVENVKYACGRSATDFGIRPAVAPPTSSALNQISNLLLRLQEAELPLEKLELFLCIISSIFDATGCPRGQQLGADDFLPILVFVVAKCGFVGAEIEAEFMWGLLQPALLSGEAGYYLTALCSAVHVLKSFMASDNEGTGSLDWRSSSLPACSSVLRVIIPDECNGSLQTRTLPVRPHTTTREVCRIIAHKARITNPQDYALFKLVDGEETLLTDVECPQDIRLAAKGKHCMLAYKRIDAKIAWPTAAQPSYA
ncbi:protein sprint isoform X2 [Eupeodes corollae]|uniref:protein sprint isoform X2 n=1 Tax=Eupeodes corollae TaxID=290404 RepID=UPI00249043B9|nr:protein sprint isoform X2 [Eupeodes corollae]